MRTTMLGNSDLEISAIGLGCMGMSQSYGATDDDESLATLNLALDSGINLLDTSDVYGNGANEELLSRILEKRRNEVVIATKFGVRKTEEGERVIDGRPDYARASCDASLQRLGVDHIDLYYLHRVDSNVPIEETVGAMSELVKAGKVRYLGLSEASADSLRRANEVHRLSALQSEWSLWTRELEVEVLAEARRLGLSIIPFSPLGRGFLTGAISSTADLEPGDFRRTSPRFADENFQANLRIVDGVRAIAERIGRTPAQVALAWVLAQGHDVVPIPGTKRRKYLLQNLEALDVELDPADLSRLDELAPIGATSGARYDTPQPYGNSPSLTP